VLTAQEVLAWKARAVAVAAVAVAGEAALLEAGAEVAPESAPVVVVLGSAPEVVAAVVRELLVQLPQLSGRR